MKSGLLVFLQQALTIVSPFFLECFLYHKFLLGSVIQKIGETIVQ